MNNEKMAYVQGTTLKVRNNYTGTKTLVVFILGMALGVLVGLMLDQGKLDKVYKGKCPCATVSCDYNCCAVNYVKKTDDCCKKCDKDCCCEKCVCKDKECCKTKAVAKDCPCGPYCECSKGKPCVCAGNCKCENCPGKPKAAPKEPETVKKK